MKDKKIDNEYVNYKREISQIDDAIDIEKQKLKRLDDMQEELAALNRNMEVCISLLAASVKGKNLGNVYRDIYDSNKRSCRKIGDAIDSTNSVATKKINNLYNDKYHLIEEQKKELEKEYNNKEDKSKKE